MAANSSIYKQYTKTGTKSLSVFLLETGIKLQAATPRVALLKFVDSENLKRGCRRPAFRTAVNFVQCPLPVTDVSSLSAPRYRRL